MATLLTPDYTYTINGVPVRVKLIPDGTRWKDAAKAKAAGFSAALTGSMRTRSIGVWNALPH